MADREKVIAGLESCAKSDPENWCYQMCELCPYELKLAAGCKHILAADVLELLKEYEPVAPKVEPGLVAAFNVYSCGHCDTVFHLWRQKYCANCGRAVKWDDDKEATNGKDRME